MSLGAKSTCTLIIGGGGFIGRHLLARLVSRNERVVVASRKPGDLPGALVYPVDILESSAVSQLLDRVKPTTVINLAARRPAGPSYEFRETIELNVLAVLGLMEECVSREIGRVVLVGSAEEYGDQAVPVPAGRSTVRLEYVDRSFHLGVGMSALGLVACCVVWSRAKPSAALITNH